MADQETLDAIAVMLDGLETRLYQKLEEKLEEKLELKLKPIRTDILTLYGEVHGLKNEMADVRDDICELRKDMDIVKKQTVYNYDKIIDNYAAIRELQTVVEGKMDKPRLVQ